MFLPASIPQLRYWLDASELELEDGTPVTISYVPIPAKVLVTKVPE